jgi:RNA polymerase sigma factor (sigma-70 family)
MPLLHDPGDNQTTKDLKTAFGRYVVQAFRNEQHRNGQLPRTEGEFLRSVEAQLLLGVGGSQKRLRELQERLEDAMAEDRRLNRAGRKAATFNRLPERKILVKAIRQVIADDRPPRRRADTSRVDLAGCEAMAGHDPAVCVVNAEMVVMVYEALQRLDPRDQAILHARYLEGLKQVEIAQRLQMPRQTVNRRLHSALAKMARYLRQAGCGD